MTQVDLSLREFIECKCPRCQITHIVYMYWTGRGIPRILCPVCKAFVAKILD